MTDELIVNIILLTVICLGVFAIIREIVCWYWKINKGILLQEKSIKNQEELIRLIKVGNSYLSEQRADKIFNHRNCNEGE